MKKKNSHITDKRLTEQEPDIFITVAALLRFCELDIRLAPYSLLETPPRGRFPLCVPKSFAARIKKSDWYDPLLLQVLPRAEEEIEREGFCADPVEDAGAQTVPGVLHKYESRALLLVANRCSINCRYCFRRDFPFFAAPSGSEAWQEAWRYLERTEAVTEAILSGGDPLCLPAGELEEHLQRLVAIPHITTIRIHSRVPVADPERIDRRTIELLSYVNSRKTCILVIQANHAAELSGACLTALGRLRAAAGVLLLNQSVLLRGVNDSAEGLCELSCALIACGVVPYYLHQLDRVRGAWHFEVEEEKGKKLLNELREKLPGYMVPRYVREVAGEKSKRNLL